MGPLDTPPDGAPERRRREEFRRSEDETVFYTALSEHEWIKQQHQWMIKAVKAALLCVLVLAVLDGFALVKTWQLASRAHDLGESNTHLVNVIQTDRRRRIHDTNTISNRTCRTIKHTNDVLIAAVRTSDDLAKETLTPKQQRERHKINRNLIKSLTIVCTPQGNPIQIK